MKARKTPLRKRLSNRLSFRQSDPDISESYHHRHATTGDDSNNTANNRRRLLALRRNSLRLSISLDASDEDKNDAAPIAVDPDTQALAIKASVFRKTSFHESLPPSLVEAYEMRDCVAPFQREEIVFGPKLGEGEFSTVYEVKTLKLQARVFQTDLSGEELDQRQYMKDYQNYRETNKGRYALKHIKEDYHVNRDPSDYVQATSDLALEAEFLASLQHPHIIKLRGITSAGPSGFKDGPGGYFLIIDRLVETLDQRLRRWRDTKTSKSQRLSRFRRSMSALPMIPLPGEKAKENQKTDVIDERLSIACQISSAMKYMHTHSIIFRDLKPQNIGFDVRGDVKIFDFGLARIMPQDGNPYTDEFEMSGAGSPRYMSPECLMDKPYNLKSDVYTFAIIVWEMLATQTPYVYVRRIDQLVRHVTVENGRPHINESWPSPIQGMLESSFDSDIGKRPKMSLWSDVIRETLTELRGGNSQGLGDSSMARRRTLDSMHAIDLSKILQESSHRGSFSIHSRRSDRGNR